MSKRYIVRGQSGVDKNGAYLRQGYGVWDTHTNKWVNKSVFQANSKGKKAADNVCYAANKSHESRDA